MGDQGRAGLAARERSRARALAVEPIVPIDKSAEAEIGWIVELISEIRSLRSEMGVPPAAQLPLTLVAAERLDRGASSRPGATRSSGSRASRRSSSSRRSPAGSLPIVVRDALAALPLAGIVDIDAEKARLEKEIARERQEIAKVDAKFANADFVARAPEEIVEENRERREASLSRIAKMDAALARLSQI